MSRPLTWLPPDTQVEPPPEIIPMDDYILEGFKEEYVQRAPTEVHSPADMINPQSSQLLAAVWKGS